MRKISQLLLLVGMLYFAGSAVVAADESVNLATNSTIDLKQSTATFEFEDVPPEGWDNLIDGDIKDWDGTTSANSEGGTPEVVIKLPEGKKYTLEKIKILADTDTSVKKFPGRFLKDFELQVSEDGKKFTSVLTGKFEQAKVDKSGFQEFKLPAKTSGKYVKLILKSNYGTPNWIQVGELEIWGYPAGK